MQFGAKIKTNRERIERQMLENQKGSPEVSIKSILGSDEEVLNLRPTDKSKHLGSYSFCFKGKTKVE